jgi:hypothetical protein
MLIDNECRLVRSAGSRASVERVDGVGYGGVQQGALGVPFDGLRQRVRRQSACMEMVHQLIGRRPVDGCNFRRAAHERDDMLALQVTSFLGDLVGEGQFESRHAVPCDPAGPRRTGRQRVRCVAPGITPSRTRRLSAVGCTPRSRKSKRPLRGESDALRMPASANGRTLEDVFHVVVRPWNDVR